MDKKIGDFISENPELSGVIFIVLGILLLIYNLKRKDGFNFEDFGFLSWQAFLSLWILTLLFLILGVKFTFNV